MGDGKWKSWGMRRRSGLTIAVWRAGPAIVSGRWRSLRSCADYAGLADDGRALRLALTYDASRFARYEQRCLIDAERRTSCTRLLFLGRFQNTPG